MLEKSKIGRPLTSLEIELRLKGKKNRRCIYKELSRLLNKDKSVIKLTIDIPGSNKKLILYTSKKRLA